MRNGRTMLRDRRSRFKVCQWSLCATPLLTSATEPTPQVFHGDAPDVVPRKPQIQRQTAIDILYENERGGFLCGRALFSSQALGSLDAAPWTNVYHKPSPTSIHNAQVPDPSWEWAWSDWHINQQEGMDEDGWEYSFAFSSKFSWHGPRWYHSFVRRRAWTRKRIRKWPDDISADPHMLNTDYFNVRPASDRVRNSQSLSSRVPSRASMTQMSSVEVDGEKPDIEDLETLLDVLRFSRIDRERLEAMKNYLTNAMDLERLAEEMHEILSLFVFQASIRHLLSYLTQVLDETTAELDKTDTAHLRDRRDALRAAIKHADEEVRRLAYWSDVKQMAHRGASKGAVDGDKGWDEDWQGLDDSGPRQPNNGKLPRCESESGSDTPL